MPPTTTRPRRRCSTPPGIAKRRTSSPARAPRPPSLSPSRWSLKHLSLARATVEVAHRRLHPPPLPPVHAALIREAWYRSDLPADPLLMKTFFLVAELRPIASTPYKTSYARSFLTRLVHYYFPKCSDKWLLRLRYGELNASWMPHVMVDGWLCVVTPKEPKSHMGEEVAHLLAMAQGGTTDGREPMVLAVRGKKVKLMMGNFTERYLSGLKKNGNFENGVAVAVDVVAEWDLECSEDRVKLFEFLAAVQRGATVRDFRD